MFHKIAKVVFAVLVISVIAFAGYKVLNLPDQRTTGERIGDAVDAMGDGAEKVGRQFKDRTPGEKLGDAVKDVGNDIKENSTP